MTFAVNHSRGPFLYSLCECAFSGDIPYASKRHRLASDKGTRYPFVLLSQNAAQRTSIECNNNAVAIQ